MHACMYLCITAHARERLARRCRRRRRGRRRAVGRRRRELRACGRPHAHSLLRPHCHTIAQHNLPSTRARAQSFALGPAQAQTRTGDRVHRQAHARGHRHTRLEDRHTNASPHTHRHTLRQARPKSGPRAQVRLVFRRDDPLYALSAAESPPVCRSFAEVSPM